MIKIYSSHQFVLVAKYGNKRTSQTKANAKFSTFSSVSSNNHGLENVTMNLEDYWDLLFLFILPKFLFALKFDVPLWININQSASRYLVMIMMNDDTSCDNHGWRSKRYLWMGQKAQWFDNGVWADGLEKGLNWDLFLPASTFSLYLPFLVTPVK